MALNKSDIVEGMKVKYTYPNIEPEVKLMHFIVGIPIPVVGDIYTVKSIHEHPEGLATGVKLVERDGPIVYNIIDFDKVNLN